MTKCIVKMQKNNKNRDVKQSKQRCETSETERFKRFTNILPGNEDNPDVSLQNLVKMLLKLETHGKNEFQRGKCRQRMLKKIKEKQMKQSW